MLRGQFTFTASRRPGRWDAEPGWKIQSAVGVPGGLPLVEGVVREAARCAGGFVPPVVPELASRADVDALPRRLRLDVVDDVACLSHVVAAGSDYSGRPNFFAHGLLVAPAGDDADDEGFLRPADLWGADLWLRPFGSDEVEAADPDDALTDLERGALDTAGLDDFMRRHPNQRDMVLAAVERRLVDGGGPVVVVGDDPGSVVQWMRLVGRLLLPGTAWRLPFSTYERARDLGTPVDPAFAMVGVPATDGPAAAGLPGSHVAVLRDGEAPLRAGADRWTLPDGSELTAERWARLAESVVAIGLLPAVAELVDELADDFGPSADDQPLWALGAAVLLLDEGLAEDLVDDAAQLVLAHWPRDLEGEVSTIVELLDQLAEHADWATIATAVSRRAGEDVESLTEQLVRVEAIRAAFSGPAEYQRHGSALATVLPDLSPDVRAELDGILLGALAWIDGAGPVAPRALLHIAALTDPGCPFRQRITELAVRVVIPRLVDPAFDPGTGGWASMPEWLWHRLRPALTERLASGDHAAGCAFSDGTNEWLGSLGQLSGELRVTSLEAAGPVEWERAAHEVFRVPRRDGGSRRHVTELERAAAFLAALHTDDLRDTEGRCWRAASDAYPRELLDLRQALVLMECVPADAPFAAVLLDVLRRTPPSAESVGGIMRLRAREHLLRTQEAMIRRHLDGSGTGLGVRRAL